MLGVIMLGNRFYKVKTYASVRLAKYPKVLALIKSVYLLKRQYDQQLHSIGISKGKTAHKEYFEKEIMLQKYRSQFAKKKVTSEVIYVAEEFKCPEFNGLKVDICIPVFNRFDLVHPLMREIRKQIDSLKITYSLEFNVLLTDDHSTSRTQLALMSLCHELEFDYKFQEKNLGVVGNVNSAFASMEGDIFILLNSDAEIAQNTMIKPFLHESKIGLVTVPNFDLFNGRLRNSLTWLELADYLEESSKQTISYVDACTAVSYAIAIRRSSVTHENLMDPAYGMGYGEDSDLHYQLVTKGWKSVWTLDTVVSHYGGASFGQNPQADSYRKFGRKLFFERWGDKYFSEIEAHELVLDNSINKRINSVKDVMTHTTLIVSPSDKEHIGGLFVVKSLIRKRIEEKKRISLRILDEIDPRNFYDLITTSPTSIDWKKVNEIIFVGIGSVRWFMGLKVPVEKIKLIFFLQGPDWIIDPNGVKELKWIRENIDEFLVTSSLTSHWATQISKNAHQEFHIPDLQFAKFSGFEEFEKEYDVLFNVRSEYGKGAHFAESMINYLSDYCKVHVVSDIPLSIDSTNVHVSPRTGTNEFLKKVARSKVFIDTSLYEGFGLVPRQAGYLNTISFLFPTAGGTSELLKFPNHFSPLGEVHDLIGNADKILKTLENLTCEGCDYCN
jgi:GT2 family glycosyltransferase